MTSITITDLNNAKTDVDHIAEISTSVALTATDRLGHVKDTLAGAMYKVSAFNRGLGKRAGLEETRGPQPFIQANLVIQGRLGGHWHYSVSKRRSEKISPLVKAAG